MKNKTIRNSLLLIITAFIWGSAFVAQSAAGDSVSPYSFNFTRMLIGSIVLLPVIAFLDKKDPSRRPLTKEAKKTQLLGGLCCGIILFIAGTLQQVGIYMGCSAGKAGFLTAFYIILVPILGLFFHRKCKLNIWISVILALVGLYLLCITESFTFMFSDILVILCAVSYSVHILVVDHFSPLVDGVRMSSMQFFVAGILSGIFMIFTEMHDIDIWLAQFSSIDAWIPILYAGVMSCGVAYTLQIIAQNGLNPAIASLLMSLESVFAVLTAWVIQHSVLSARELIGCVLMFIAIILAQLF